MKKNLFVALAVLGLSACNSGPEFKVEGEISGADGKMLYLEASALEGIVPLDSVKLKSDGTFAFKQACPVSPEFYRLRVDDKVINFSIDSAETVRFNAPYTDFSTAYTVEGSANSVKIKELTLKQMQLQTNVNALIQSMQAHKIGTDVFEILFRIRESQTEIEYFGVHESVIKSTSAGSPIQQNGIHIE